MTAADMPSTDAVWDAAHEWESQPWLRDLQAERLDAAIQAYAREYAAARVAEVAGPLVEALAETLSTCFELAAQQAMPDDWWKAKTAKATAALLAYKETTK